MDGRRELQVDKQCMKLYVYILQWATILTSGVDKQNLRVLWQHHTLLHVINITKLLSSFQQILPFRFRKNHH